MSIPKYKKLKRYLLDDIRHKLPGDTLPTVAGLRQQFGISQATVERALNELRAEGLISSRRGSGIFVAERARMSQIALLAPYDIFDPRRSEFPRLLLHSLQGRAAERRMLLRHYIPSGGDWSWNLPFSHLQTDIRNKQIDGCVAVELWNADPAIDWQVPIVCMEALPAIANRVLTDRLAVIRKGVQALVDRGCRQIGMIGDRDAPNQQIQQEAFRAIIAEAGAETRPEWLGTVGGDQADKYLLAGRRYAEALTQAAESPAAIVSLDDYVTRGVLDYWAVQAGSERPVPLIATQSNRGSIILRDAPVIRIEFDLDLMAEALLDLLADVTDDPSQPQTRYIHPRLVAND